MPTLPDLDSLVARVNEQNGVSSAATTSSYKEGDSKVIKLEEVNALTAGVEGEVKKGINDNLDAANRVGQTDTASAVGVGIDTLALAMQGVNVKRSTNDDAVYQNNSLGRADSAKKQNQQASDHAQNKSELSAAKAARDKAATEYSNVSRFNAGFNADGSKANPLLSFMSGLSGYSKVSRDNALHRLTVSNEQVVRLEQQLGFITEQGSAARNTITQDQLDAADGAELSTMALSSAEYSVGQKEQLVQNLATFAGIKAADVQKHIQAANIRNGAVGAITQNVQASFQLGMQYASVAQGLRSEQDIEDYARITLVTMANAGKTAMPTDAEIKNFATVLRANPDQLGNFVNEHLDRLGLDASVIMGASSNPQAHAASLYRIATAEGATPVQINRAVNTGNNLGYKDTLERQQSKDYKNLITSFLANEEGTPSTINDWKDNNASNPKLIEETVAGLQTQAKKNAMASMYKLLSTADSNTTNFGEEMGVIPTYSFKELADVSFTAGEQMSMVGIPATNEYPVFRMKEEEVEFIKDFLGKLQTEEGSFSGQLSSAQNMLLTKADSASDMSRSLKESGITDARLAAIMTHLSKVYSTEYQNDVQDTYPDVQPTAQQDYTVDLKMTELKLNTLKAGLVDSYTGGSDKSISMNDPRYNAFNTPNMTSIADQKQVAGVIGTAVSHTLENHRARMGTGNFDPTDTADWLDILNTRRALQALIQQKEKQQQQQKAAN